MINTSDAELINALATIGVERKKFNDYLSDEDIKFGQELAEAASSGDLDSVKTKIEEGAALGYKNENGDTAFHFAARNGHEAVVEYFLEQGQNINTMNDDETTPLMLASQHGHSGVVKLLGSKGAKLNLKKYSNGATALRLAVGDEDTAGDLQTLTELLLFGADPEITDDGYYTPAERANQWRGEENDFAALLQIGQYQKEIKEAMVKATEEGNEKFVNCMTYILSRDEGRKSHLMALINLIHV